MTSLRAKTTAIYVRISRDDGTRLGVERQQEDCIARCDAEGWTSRVYEDNDISAYTGKKRPAYEQMMQDLAAGKLQRIVAYRNDRLHRSPRDLEDFIDAVQANKVEVVVLQGGTYDLTTASGRITARLLGAVARGESENASERIKRKHQELRETGAFPGGLIWGYDNKGNVIESEAKIIREVAERFIGGHTLIGLSNELHNRGVLSKTGKRIKSFTLKQSLSSPAIAGLRRNGENFVVGQWEGIITPEQFRHIGLILGNPSRKTNGGISVRKHWLSGITVCGKCGAFLKVKNNNKVFSFTCNRQDGCNGVSMKYSVVEDAVYEALKFTLNEAQIQAPAPDFVEAEEIKSQLERLNEVYIRGNMKERQYSELSSELSSELEKLTSFDPLSTVVDFENQWVNSDVTWKNAIASRIISKVTIHPANGTRASLNRIEIERRKIDQPSPIH